MMIAVFAFFVGLSAARGDCPVRPSAELARLKKQAGALLRAGDAAGAAGHWQQVAGLYPICALRERREAVIRALNILETLPAPLERTCNDPALQRARLVRRTLDEMLAPSDSKHEQARAHAVLRDRQAALPEAARDAAEFLDGPGLPAETIDARYTTAVASFGACPELRAALLRHVEHALPSEQANAPSCDDASHRGRALLRQTMTALERSEPTGVQTTAEYKALAERLAALNGEGPILSATRARATKERDADQAGSAWAELARGLPICAAYRPAIQDAATAAVAAWQRGGKHILPPAERYARSRRLLDDILAGFERAPGAAAFPEHTSLAALRAGLKPPPTEKARQPLAPAPRRAPDPATRAPPARWIDRHHPERSMIEIGVVFGVMAPASGLLAKNAGGSHQLFDPYAQRDSLDAGGPPFYKPYRKIAAEFGLRLAWYPVSFLGGEFEGGVMPTRIVVDGTPTDRAVLFHARGHLILQLPFWCVTPFVLIGGGALGTTGALGKDTDPTLNLGGGVKLYATRYLALRLDLRDNIGAALGFGTGGTHYPEMLLGLSFTLNRRSERPASASRSALANPTTE